MSKRVIALILLNLIGGSACQSRTVQVNDNRADTGGANEGQANSGDNESNPSMQADTQTGVTNTTNATHCGMSSATTHGDQLDVGDQPWRQVPVPSIPGGASVVRVPDGWMAASGRQLLAEKVVTGGASALYWSADGIDWDLIPLQLSGDYAFLRAFAYGNGHYVMVSGNPAETWHSADGRNWTHTAQGLESGYEWQNVAYAEGKFIAYGFNQYGISSDGVMWDITTLDTVGTKGVAYGNGLYMMVGSGSVATAPDARDWAEHRVECVLAGSCLPDSRGAGSFQLFPSLVFGGDCFYAGTLASEDGADWEVAAPLAVHAYVDETFLHFDGSNVYAWTAGQVPQEIPVTFFGQDEDAGSPASTTDVGTIDTNAPPPEHLSFPFDDGLTCESARCVVIENNLFLIPPSGA